MAVNVFSIHQVEKIILEVTPIISFFCCCHYNSDVDLPILTELEQLLKLYSYSY